MEPSHVVQAVCEARNLIKLDYCTHLFIYLFHLGHQFLVTDLGDRCGAVELRALDGAMGRVLELN